MPPFLAVISGTSEVSKDFTTAPRSKSTNGDSTAAVTTSEGRAGMEIQVLKHLLTNLREVTRGFYCC